MEDTLHRFVFENAPVRGEIVHLDETWRAAAERHPYPAPLLALLGELMAAAALLAPTLKFRGSVILQMQGNGPVRLAVAECTSDHTLRAAAKWDGELGEGLRALAGDGRFAITLAREDGGQSYQGVVSLDADSVAAAIERYMRDSEQLDTRLWIACGADRVAGMLLQRLPSSTEADAEDWSRISQLAATITPAELAGLAPHTVIRRLFHEEDVRLFGSQRLQFRCSCSRERVAAMLKMLGQDEVHSIIEERGAVDVSCEFCNSAYRFDAAQALAVFATADPGGAAARH